MSTAKGALERLVNHIWYGNSILSWCLIPLTWPVRWVIHRRRKQAAPKGNTPDGITLIVVGGLTAGGTGKTPVLIGLGKWLAEQGYRVGVVSRGYGGTHGPEPHSVTAGDTAAVAGDEPLLIQRELGVPVVVCADRKRALDVLVDQNSMDVVLSDDGLQHYPMPRDIELLLLDAERGLGNGRLLPAGPLREPASRLANVDMVLEHMGEHLVHQPGAERVWFDHAAVRLTADDDEVDDPLLNHRGQALPHRLPRPVHQRALEHGARGLGHGRASARGREAAQASCTMVSVSPRSCQRQG